MVSLILNGSIILNGLEVNKMTHVVIDEAINETERLIRLSNTNRDNEGIYATNKQLTFLLKKIKKQQNNKNPHFEGIIRFVVDITSPDSKLLYLADKLEKLND